MCFLIFLHLTQCLPFWAFSIWLKHGNQRKLFIRGNCQGLSLVFSPFFYFPIDLPLICCAIAGWSLEYLLVAGDLASFMIPSSLCLLLFTHCDRKELPEVLSSMKLSSIYYFFWNWLRKDPLWSLLDSYHPIDKIRQICLLLNLSKILHGRMPEILTSIGWTWEGKHFFTQKNIEKLLEIMKISASSVKDCISQGITYHGSPLWLTLKYTIISGYNWSLEMRRKKKIPRKKLTNSSVIP